MQTISATTTGTLWNGPVCGTCGRGYITSPHKCSPEDIKRKIAELQALLGCPGCGQHIEGAHFCPGPQEQSQWGAPENCSCNPKNGGSGVCGCIFGGPRITC